MRLVIRLEPYKSKLPVPMAMVYIDLINDDGAVMETITSQAIMTNLNSAYTIDGIDRWIDRFKASSSPPSSPRE